MSTHSSMASKFRWLNFFLLIGSSAGLAYGVCRGLAYFQQAQVVPLLPRLCLILLIGVGGICTVFFLSIKGIEQLPDRIQERVTPMMFIGPAVLLLAWILLIPLLRTIWMSFLDTKGIEWVGFENFRFALTDATMVRSFKNNLLWLFLGSGGSVFLGLSIAFLADRTNPRFSSIIQSCIFMPMAISMVGASIIWRFMYAYVPPGSEQIGLINAMLSWWGGTPQAFLMNRSINTIMLILVFIWIQTGFSLVVFSAAIKTIPGEILEAARIDGANEWQATIKISIPYLRNTILAVATIVVVLTLKVFDVVYVMTGGNYGTEVIANQFYFEMFRKFNYGHGSAIVVILLILILPVTLYNLRQYQETWR